MPALQTGMHMSVLFIISIILLAAQNHGAFFLSNTFINAPWWRLHPHLEHLQVEIHAQAVQVPTIT